MKKPMNFGRTKTPSRERVTFSNGERPQHQSQFPVPAIEQNQGNESDEWTAIYQTIRDLRQDDFNYLGSSVATQFWSRLRPILLRTAQQQIAPELRPKFDASDVAQKSMIEIQAGLPRFVGKSPNELRSWIHRIVQNNVVDAGRTFRNSQRRDISRETALDDGTRRIDVRSDHRTASSLMIRDENEMELMQLVLQLPQRGKQILELRHYHSMSYAEIGNEMGMTEVAARKLYSRTIEELRKRLAQNANDNGSV